MLWLLSEVYFSIRESNYPTETFDTKLFWKAFVVLLSRICLFKAESIYLTRDQTINN